MSKIIIHTINGLFASVTVPEGIEVELRNHDNHNLEIPPVVINKDQIGEVVFEKTDDPNYVDSFLKVDLDTYRLHDHINDGTVDYYLGATAWKF